MSYETYKVIHLIGAFLLLATAGGVALHAANGGTRENNTLRKLVGALHGVALLILLVAGFGLLAKLGIKHDWIFPGWVWTKLVIWVVFAIIATLPYRKPELARLFLWLLPLLGGVSAYLAIFKPF